MPLIDYVPAKDTKGELSILLEGASKRSLMVELVANHRPLAEKVINDVYRIRDGCLETILIETIAVVVSQINHS